MITILLSSISKWRGKILTIIFFNPLINLNFFIIIQINLNNAIAWIAWKWLYQVKPVNNCRVKFQEWSGCLTFFSLKPGQNHGVTAGIMHMCYSRIFYFWVIVIWLLQFNLVMMHVDLVLSTTRLSENLGVTFVEERIFSHLH